MKRRVRYGWVVCAAAAVAAALAAPGFPSGRASPLPSPSQQLDGTWSAELTVTTSASPLAQPGQKLTGLEFTVQGGSISGDFTGTIDLTPQTVPTLNGPVYLAQVSSAVLGSGAGCQGEIYFASQGSSYVGTRFDDSIQCQGGQIHATVDGYRAGAPASIVVAGLGDSVGSGEGIVPFADKRCHRSNGAFEALVANRVQREIAAPHAGATFRFVHLACSGASIEQGLVAPYAGIEAPAGAAPLPAQVDELARQLGKTRIDALLLSIGANDLGFGSIVRFCVLQTVCFTKPYTYQGRRYPTLDAFVAGRLKLLPALFARLDARLEQLTVDPSHIFLTAYFDPLVGRELAPCSYSATIGQLSPAESQWASFVVVNGLDTALAAAAARYRWTFVSKIQTAFLGHGVCAGSQSWITGLYEALAQQKGDPSGFMHPNATGAQIIAGFVYPPVAAAIRQDVGS